MAKKNMERQPLYRLLFSDRMISPSDAERKLQENKNKKSRNLGPYPVAHLALAARFGEGYFFKGDMQETLESTPGLVLNPGTTIDNVISKMQGWSLLEILD